MAGNITRALALWKKAFHQDPEQQMRIIELLAPQMPVHAFSRQFEPDLPATGKLYSFYRKNKLIEQARYVGTNYASLLGTEAMRETGSEAAGWWDRARSVHQFLGNQEKAIQCACNAVAQAPDDFGRHRTLASALVNARQYDEAIRELRWCLGRKPDDEGVKQMLRIAGRERVLDTGATLR